MAVSVAPLRELDGCRPEALPLDTLLAAGEPVVLRGLVVDWPLVAAGRGGPGPAVGYLKAHAGDRPVQFSHGDPEVRGRPFYRDGFTQLNCAVRRGPLREVVDEIAAHLDDAAPPTYYVASQRLDACAPSLRAANDLDFAAWGIAPTASIWIGNRVTASCHYDVPDNIACCAVGRRRFTLFPPDQIGNLYPGPLEPAPGGQAVSIVDFSAPDFERFPRFRDALDTARGAELEPGDALFIPSMWWHHVEALAPFNVLVNYWWSRAPAWAPSPMHALQHALWAIRDRPEREKQAWRAVFEYYVFGDGERAGAHLPEAARGVLGPIDEIRARQLRAMLIDRLNR